jgi:hypothetical protein
MNIEVNLENRTHKPSSWPSGIVDPGVVEVCRQMVKGKWLHELNYFEVLDQRR